MGATVIRRLALLFVLLSSPVTTTSSAGSGCCIGKSGQDDPPEEDVDFGVYPACYESLRSMPTTFFEYMSPDVLTATCD